MSRRIFTSSPPKTPPSFGCARRPWIGQTDALIVSLSDGREFSTPLEWFPRLRDATPRQRKNWRLIARGLGIHGEQVDEDIAVSTLWRAS
jgi:hypothetical protein